ncbi:MAG: putative CRISPR-associated protein, partial [Spirulinaceae cyanobacterium]
MKTIITTTGTSLLSNARRILGQEKAENDDELRHLFTRLGAEKASAETNSLLKIGTPKDQVILLHTNTPEGTRCCQLIEQYLQGKSWKKVQSRQLSLEENEAQFERQGLRELVNTLIDEINKAQRQSTEVVINATGGFKAQIAYTTMVGMIFQVPVKYIYQNFEQPITFPTLPVSWN